MDGNSRLELRDCAHRTQLQQLQPQLGLVVIVAVAVSVAVVGTHCCFPGQSINVGSSSLWVAANTLSLKSFNLMEGSLAGGQRRV